MISAGDFRNGVTFDDNGVVYQIIEFQHVKPGKGAAFVRTKIRNIMTGSVTERTFNPSDKFPSAYIERKDMSYTYADGSLYYFMDPDTYEQLPINESDLPDSFRFVREGDVVKILSYKGKVFGIEAPAFAVLTVTKTDPGFKGNTATNTLKPPCLKRAPRSVCRCLSTRETSSRSKPKPAPTLKECSRPLNFNQERNYCNDDW